MGRPSNGNVEPGGYDDIVGPPPPPRFTPPPPPAPGGNPPPPPHGAGIKTGNAAPMTPASPEAVSGNMKSLHQMLSAPGRMHPYGKCGSHGPYQMVKLSEALGSDRLSPLKSGSRHKAENGHPCANLKSRRCGCCRWRRCLLFIRCLNQFKGVCVLYLNQYGRCLHIPRHATWCASLAFF